MCQYKNMAFYMFFLSHSIPANQHRQGRWQKPYNVRRLVEPVVGTSFILLIGLVLCQLSSVG